MSAARAAADTGTVTRDHRPTPAELRRRRRGSRAERRRVVLLASFLARLAAR
jgi:hypothetical protein